MGSLNARITRWVLTAVLLYMVYRETGPWTAGVLTLTLIGLEAQSYTINVLRRSRDTTNKLGEVLRRLGVR